MPAEAGSWPDPETLRTFSALQATLKHLRCIMRQEGYPLLTRQRFLWDRYRCMRKDMSQTGLAFKGRQQLAWCIAANEEIFRFCILVDAQLAHIDLANTPPQAPGANMNAARLNFRLSGLHGGNYVSEQEVTPEPEEEGDSRGWPAAYDGHLNHVEANRTLLDLTQLYRVAQQHQVCMHVVCTWTTCPAFCMHDMCIGTFCQAVRMHVPCVLI